VALTATVALAGAVLVEHPALWEIHVEIHNDEDSSRRLVTGTLLGAVSFEIVDAAGAPVPLGPPPMPPSDLEASVAEIAPGGSLALDFTGNELLADAPPPGAYRLRFAVDVPAVDGAPEALIVSPWVAFEVATR
jgi:hypothetical protein